MKHAASDILRWWRIDAGGVVGCALVTAACYYALIQPAIQSRETYDALRPEVASRSQALRDARETASNLQAELDRITTELAQVPLKLESSSRVNSRLAGLAELASDHELELHQLLPDAMRSGDRYDVVPIFLSGNGDYTQITGFMKRVNEQFADVAVIGFDLQSQGKPDQPAKFDIGLAWYTLPAMGYVEK